MSTLEVTVIDGRVLNVDISNEACGKFGFKHGEKIIAPLERPGVVVGVAPIPESSGCTEAGDNMLWVALDGLGGKVCFFPDPASTLQKKATLSYALAKRT
jgi:hypothetical protein